MKDHKGSPSHKVQMDNEFLETIDQIKDGLDKLDFIENNTPDEQWFEQMVRDQQEQIKKKYRKELVWFIFSAVIILSCVIFTLLEIPLLFLALQGAAVYVAVIYSYKGKEQVAADE